MSITQSSATETVVNLERMEPHNDRAERSALGSMLLSRDAVIAVNAVIKPEHYYRPSHRLIHSVITDMFGAGEPANLLSVTRELERRGDLVRIGGPLYLSQLLDNVTTVGEGAYDAEFVLEKAILRQVVKVGHTLADLGYSGRGDLDDVRDIVAGQLQTLLDTTKRREEEQEEFGGGEMMDAVTEYWESPDQGGLPLPWKGLADDVDLMPGNLVIVGARPAVGKSNVLLNIAGHLVLKHDEPVLLYSLEMNRLEIGQRLLSAEARVGLDDVKSGKFRSREDHQRVVDAQIRVRKAPLTISERTAVPTSHMRLKLRELEAEGRLPKAMIVDYLQIMGAGAFASSNRATEVDKMAGDLKNIAKDFGIVVIAAAQLNRGVASRADKRPTMTDLRESGGIENHANVIILLDRPEQYEEGSIRAGEMDLIVAKNRQGRTPTIAVAWQGRFCRAIDFGTGGIPQSIVLNGVGQ